MIKGKDIVVIGIQPWDIEIGSNCKDIAREFSKNNRVLFINIPYSFLEIMKNKKPEIVKNRLDAIKNPSTAIKKIDNNLYTFTPPIKLWPINFLPSTALFSVFNKINNRKLSDSIKKALTELEFNDFYLFNDQHIFLGYYLKELLKPQLSIYYIRDNLQIVRYWQKHGHILEPKLIAKSDIVFTNSLYYEEYAKNYNNQSYMVGQGCDIQMYRPEKTEVAEELKNIKKPIIGYVGYLSAKRLDVEIISQIAQDRPDYSIVLVGPESEEFKNSRLHEIPNVIFLGSKSPEQLPSYIKGFDVAMNPQQLTKATIGNYPRKIDEYLAMGKATVATKTKAMEWFKDSVTLCEKASDYPQAIDKLLENDSEELRQKRIKVGYSHSWTTSVNLMYEKIKKLKK